MKQLTQYVGAVAILSLLVMSCDPVADSASDAVISSHGQSSQGAVRGLQPEVWVSNQGEGVHKVQVLDANLNLITEIEASGERPHMGSFTDNGLFFYSANVGVSGPGNNVDKINTRTKQIEKTISIPDGESGSIHATVVRPGSREVWLNNLADKFYVIDRNPPAEEITGEVEMMQGDTPVCMAFTANGKKMYVSNTGSGSFALVDPDARVNKGTIPNGDTGGAPCGLMLDQSKQRMLATVGGRA